MKMANSQRYFKKALSTQYWLDIHVFVSLNYSFLCKSDIMLKCSQFPVLLFLFFASCSLLPILCFLFYVSYSMLSVLCFLFSASCSLLPVLCFLFYASCSLLPVICFLFYASFLFPFPSFSEINILHEFLIQVNCPWMFLLKICATLLKGQLHCNDLSLKNKNSISENIDFFIHNQKKLKLIF